MRRLIGGSVACLAVSSASSVACRASVRLDSSSEVRRAAATSSLSSAAIFGHISGGTLASESISACSVTRWRSDCSSSSRDETSARAVSSSPRSCDSSVSLSVDVAARSRRADSNSSRVALS